MQKSFQLELSKCYKNPQLISYINKQIIQLSYTPLVKSLQKFTIIKFKLPNISSSYKFTTDNHCIEFYFILSKGFPVHAPRVHVRQGLIMPGINDCRDLLYNIIEKQAWDHNIRLKTIQEQIVKFLVQLCNKNKNNNIFYVARLGTFQLNNVYPVQIIKQLRQEHIFYALQFTQQNQFRMVIIDVSSTHITIFTTKQQPHYQNDTFKIPQQKQITYCMLVFYAQLGSISEIYIDRNNFSDVHITFTAKKPHNMLLQTCIKTKKLKAKKGLLFVHKLIKGIKYYDSTDIKLNFYLNNINQQQKHIINQIKLAQQTIQRRLNYYTIKQLVSKYQQAVEYYSSHNIPYYEIYLDYITKLYQRKQVRIIMGTDVERKKTM